MLIMATFCRPLLAFGMIMADISTEIDVRRSALIGRMLLSGAVLLVFGGGPLTPLYRLPALQPFRYIHVYSNH
jgi:hypothetical protein